MSTATALTIDAGIIASALGVAMLFVQMTKPFIDAWLNPLTSSVHDAAVMTYAFLVTLVVVGGLTWAGPGITRAQDWVPLGINTLIAVAGEFGIYAKVKPIPSTPTAAYLAHTAKMMAEQGPVVYQSEGTSLGVPDRGIKKPKLGSKGKTERPVVVADPGDTASGSTHGTGQR